MVSMMQASHYRRANQGDAEMRARSAGSGGSVVLSKELLVHGDQQLLSVLSEARIAPDRLNHVNARLIVAGRDGEIAEQPRQCSWLQLQGPFQIQNLGWHRQRTTVLPLCHSGLTHTCRTSERSERQSVLCPGLLEDPPELLSARSDWHGDGSLTHEAGALSIAYLPSGMGYRTRAVLSTIQIVLTALRCTGLDLLCQR